MRKIIGIIGPIGAGKDLITNYLQKRLNCSVYQISSELKDLAKENNISLNRENLINYSRQLVSIYGDEYLAKRILEKNNEELIIVAGMRQIGQIDYLKNNSSLLLIGVYANPKIRFERVLRRKKMGDPQTFENFVKIEKEEDGVSVQRISDCMKKVDYLIKNETDEANTYSQVESILKKEKILKSN